MRRPRGLHGRAGIDRADAYAVQPGREPGRLDVERGARRGRHRLEQVHRRPRPPSSWTQAADDPPVDPGGRAGVAVAVEEVGTVRRRGTSRAPSSPSPSGRAPAAAPPTARRRRLGLDVVGQHPPGAAAVERHLDGLDRGQRRSRTAPLVRAEPPDQVVLGAGTEGAQPARGRSRRTPPRASAAPADASSQCGHQRPARPGEPPVLGVGAAHEVGGETEVGEHATVVPDRRRR